MHEPTECKCSSLCEATLSACVSVLAEAVLSYIQVTLTVCRFAVQHDGQVMLVRPCRHQISHWTDRVAHVSTAGAGHLLKGMGRIYRSTVGKRSTVS